MPANTTTITWTQKTLNVAVGCSRVGKDTECEHCYAARDACRRADKPEHPLYKGVIKQPGPGGRKYDWSGRVNYSWDKLLEIGRIRKGSKVFINSMSDTFHDKIADEFIKALFVAMAKRPDVVFQILTKRSKRLAQLAPSLTLADNIWIGVTAGMTKSLDRLDDLRRVPAKVRFVSAEPLLENIDLLPWLEDGTLSQVVVGGESKSGFRPMEDKWVREIRDVCVYHGVAFFFKQRAGLKPEKHPELDGVIWEQYPDVPPADDKEARRRFSRVATDEPLPEGVILPPAVRNFDYTLVPADTETRLKAAAIAIRGKIRATMESMVETGAALLAIKDLLPYGTWGDWLDAEFAMSDRHARSLMAVATAFGGRMENFSDLAVLPATAISKLAVVPPKIVNEVLEKVRAGECQTLNDVTTIIMEATPPKPSASPRAQRTVPSTGAMAPSPSVPVVQPEEINGLLDRVRGLSAKVIGLEQTADPRTTERLVELRGEVDGISRIVVELLTGAGLLAPAAATESPH